MIQLLLVGMAPGLNWNKQRKKEREEDPAEGLAQRAFMKQWLELIDSDHHQALKMHSWVHQPKEGPIAALIGRFLDLPLARRQALLKEHGLPECACCFTGNKKPPD